MNAAYPLMVFVLVTFAVAGSMYAFLQPQMLRAEQLRRRTTMALFGSSVSAAPSRKKTIEDFIREAGEDGANERPKRPTLEQRLRQAELPLSLRQYWLASLGTGVIALGMLMTLTAQALPVIAILAAAIGLLLPHLFVERRRNARFQRFTQEFPNAIDVVVRGVKSGLPLADCLKIIAAEAQDPVKSEFRKAVEDQTLGMTNEEVVHRLAVRVPLPEVRFFGIVIAIQSRTGGSLSEALGNLSRVLRERKKMREKIKAMSSEAKTSAGIIAALPFAVAFFVYLTSPDYISLLFTTTLGNMVLLGCGAWMGMGVLVMRNMINFQI
ncbi:MAG: type II secretion system F family protein [Pararhodobacter sp.]|nr:type II secretion system F family protein [Pararhodobacter sp.]